MSVAMLKYPNIMNPGRIGRLHIRNRIVMPAMGSGLAEMGYPGDRIIEYYRRRAAGGVGLLIIEASYVVPIPGLMSGHLSLAYDDHLEAWQRLVNAIRQEGAAVGVQLQHFGRQTSKATSGDLRTVAPSAIASPVSRVVPHELTIEETEEIIQAFASAARRASLAGVDLVEVHGGHGYLGSNFLSPNTNIRTDKYGGGQRERARFLIEVIQAIKSELGQDFPVSCRFNGNDFMEGGMSLVDAREAAQALMESGVDVLHVSAGTYGSYPAIVPPSAESQGCFVEMAESIKQVVPVSVITVGRIKTPKLAEKILAENKANFIALGRAQIADPEWCYKSLTGREADINPCIGCNQGCIDHVNSGRPITCTVNPWVGREYKLVSNSVQNREKVVVVGGGPAGLNAAWVMAGRGYQVTLVEEQETLGGQLNLAAIPPGKEEFRETIEYLVRKIQTAGVEVILGKRADGSLLRSLNPDKVVLATGARPITPGIKGIETAQAVQAWDVLRQGEVEGQKVAIIGGGAVGIETAEFLSVLGKDVTVIEMLPFWGKGMGPICRWYVKNKLDKKEMNFQILTSTKVIFVDQTGLTLERNGETFKLEGIDRIVFAVGARPVNSLLEDIANNLKVPVFVVGDAKETRNALEAVSEGVDIGLSI